MDSLDPALKDGDCARFMFKSRFWWWDGQQYDGNLLLTSLRDSSVGIRAPENKCRILEGEDDKRQRDAIAYFLTRK